MKKIIVAIAAVAAAASFSACTPEEVECWSKPGVEKCTFAPSPVPDGHPVDEKPFDAPQADPVGATNSNP